MREIKFRAWDKEQGMIWYIETINFTNGRFDVYGLSTKNIERWYLNVTPMQYTGLKDKNGKEIYEGDIVSLGDMNILYVIEWHDTGLVAKQIRTLSYAGISYWNSVTEIVGNRYENPELMKWYRKVKGE